MSAVKQSGLSWADLDLIRIPELTLDAPFGVWFSLLKPSVLLQCGLVFDTNPFVHLIFYLPVVPILILSVKPSSLSIFRDAGPLTNWPLSVSEGAKCSVPSSGPRGRGSASS